jgi:hypothetical protein
MANIILHAFSAPSCSQTPMADIAPQRAINHITMVNAVINQDTGASLEYHQLIQDDTVFPIWKKAAANECGRLAQGIGGHIEGSKTIFFIPRQEIPKGRLSLMDVLWWTSIQIHLTLTASASLGVGTSSNIQGMCTRAQQTSQLISASGTAPLSLKVLITFFWMSRLLHGQPNGLV